MSIWQKTILLCTMAFLTACANSSKRQGPDYSAFERHRPNAILVLPPINSSVDINAIPAVLAASVQPLAEAGYYVVPVTNMMEMFQQNGMLVAEDIHSIAPAKLQEFFGADAALYMTVEKYGVRYNVLDSLVEVSVTAKLIDLHSGQLLWQNRVDQVTGQSDSNNVLGRLVGAVVNQIANNLSDKAWPASQQAMFTLFRHNRGVLKGPYLDDQHAKR